jgi:prepilin peptidase CpaA
MLATAVLLVLLTVASVTDVRWHTIGNWLVYPGILLALAMSAVATLVGKDLIQGTVAEVSWLGIPDFWLAVGGLLTCGSIMLVCYVFFPGGVGGGDVKLLAMMGAFLGIWQGLEAMLWTFVLGGCFGVITLVWRVGLTRLLGQMVTRIRSVWRARSWLPLTDAEREPLQVHLFLSPAALLAVVIVRFGLLEHL